MINDFHHITLNGVNYRLAENAEGQHYNLRMEPLRPPNAQVVAGENNVFQMRPDMLQWSLTDWSGGMGQLRFDPQNPNRWFLIAGADVFTHPGEFRRGWHLVPLENNAGAVRDFEDTACMWHSSKTAFRVYSSDDYFSYTLPNVAGAAAGTAVTGLDDASDICAVVFDGAHTFFTQAGNNTLYRATDAAPQTAIVVETGAILPTGATVLTQLGPYVYVMKGGVVWEAAKSGTGDPLELFDPEIPVVLFEDMVAMGGKIYTMVSTNAGAEVFEITPTSAAGPGFGRPVGGFPGFTPDTLHAYGGLLYLSHGISNAAPEGTQQVYLYMDPNGSSGTIGTIEPDTNDNFGVQNSSAKSRTSGAAATTHYFGLWWKPNGIVDPVETDYGVAAVEVDGPGGGFAVLAYSTAGGNDNDEARKLEVFPTDRASLVVMERDGSVSRLYICENDTGFRDKSAPMAAAVSPFFDFGIASEKILSSIQLDCTPPTGTEEIHIDIKLGPGEVWDEDVAVFDASDTVFGVTLSTSGTPLVFSSLQIRIRILYDAAAPDEDNVILRGINVFAQVATKVRVWDLLIDVGDSTDLVLPYGKQKIDSLITAAGGQIVPFVDGYQSGVVTAPTAVDVVVDSMEMLVARPGEGVAHVVLREVG